MSFTQILNAVAFCYRRQVSGSSTQPKQLPTLLAAGISRKAFALAGDDTTHHNDPKQPVVVARTSSLCGGRRIIDDGCNTQDEADRHKQRKEMPALGRYYTHPRTVTLAGQRLRGVHTGTSATGTTLAYRISPDYGRKRKPCPLTRKWGISSCLRASACSLHFRWQNSPVNQRRISGRVKKRCFPDDIGWL